MISYLRLALSLIKNIISHEMNMRRIQKKYYAEGLQLEKPFNIFDESKLTIFSPVYIGPNSNLYLRGCLSIDSGTIIGPSLTVHTANHNYEGVALPYDEKYIASDVKIGKNVWIGANCTILPGVSIGEGAVVAASSVVSKSVPDFAVVAGNPAKIIKYRDIERYNNNKSKKNIYLNLKRTGKTELNESKRIIYKER